LDEATRVFAQIQHAYETLSDDQERAWYDSHRDAILRGDDPEDYASGGSGGGFWRSDVTQTNDLMRYFSPTCYSGFGEDNNGFYKVYSTVFQKLQQEESSAFSTDSECLDVSDETLLDSVPFGNSTTRYEPVVKEFYAIFTNFSTIKSFRWFDKYRLSDAPDRNVRRYMERENLKSREAARREFNDTVRRLAAFVQKRDPRYKVYMDEQKELKNQKAEELKARMKKEKEERLQQKQAYSEPEWVKAASEEHLEMWDEEDEDGISNELFCAACNKVFKSDKQVTIPSPAFFGLKFAIIVWVTCYCFYIVEESRKIKETFEELGTTSCRITRGRRRIRRF
jgi:DnaJ family protein A protein 5